MSRPVFCRKLFTAFSTHQVAIFASVFGILLLLCSLSWHSVLVTVAPIFMDTDLSTEAIVGKRQESADPCHQSHKSMDYWLVDLHRLSGSKGQKSQGAQDMYFERIFAYTGTTNRYFVEFGFNEPSYTSGGSGANTWNLYDSGWRGLLLDGSRENTEINLHAHYLFEGNIGSVLGKYEVPKDFDLLSCDMDSHDIFVLGGILKSGYRPRVFTTEYNSNYPLEYAITLIDPTIIGADVSAYNFEFKHCAWGASASALRTVAEKFGYTLVGRVGLLDLVWLRNDLIKEDWEVPAFEWFFKDAPLGQLHHGKQTSDDIFEYLVDFDVLEKTGSVQKAKEAARVKLEPSGLACFNFSPL
jgi:hypothetical protein